MKRPYSPVLFVILLLVFFLAAFSAEGQQLNEKNILILHSYHQGLEWTDHITEGILSVFREREEINLVFEYLDTKRYFDTDYLTALIEMNVTKKRQIRFDIIIASDNAAYDFLKENGSRFYPEVPIVFCGVNNLDKAELEDYPLFYGFAEQADHIGTIESIIRVFPDRKNVLIINDNTLTGRNILNELETVMPLYSEQLNFEIISDFSLEGLKDRVKSLDESYVIYLLVLNRDRTGKFISYSRGISFIHSVSDVPIFGSWDFYMDRGLFGGKITRGVEQGRNAALLAENLLDNGIIEDIKQVDSVASDFIFDYHELSRFDISKRRLPEGSELINRPIDDDFFQKFISLVALLSILIVIVMGLRLLLHRRRSRHLKEIVAEQTQSLTTANLKLEDIISKNRKFFSILAHDLRNSIGSLVQTSNLLKDEKIKLSPDNERFFKTEIYNCANNTNGLLEDLLFWGHNQFENRTETFFAELKLDEVLRSIAEIFIYNQGNVSFNFEMTNDIGLISDINITTFIFRNLIQNAVKFSNENGVVTITCRRESDSVIVKIIDEGMGMTEEMIESIYNKKPIIQKGKFDKKNSGLGLPTVIEYLEELGGELNIISQPDNGTTVTVKIRDWKSELSPE